MENETEKGMHLCAFPPSLNRVLPLAIVFLIFILSAPFTATGQKLTRYYTAALIDSGTLYFIFPLDDFQERVTKSRLIFDISYLSSRDSATVNFSYFLPSARPADSVTFHSPDKVIMCRATKLFIDVENHQKWHHRFTTTIHLNDLARFFQSAIPPEIIITTNEGRHVYRIKKYHWKKQGNIISTVFQMIEANS
jgi:hypothetical protein